MDNRYVGIFDSGFGGLTAVREFRRLMPQENIIYFGDSGRMPYGPRSREQVRKFARQNLSFMESFGVKQVIVACGTISSNCRDILQRQSVPVVNVLDPGVAAMARIPGTGPLGIIATAATIRSGAFADAIGACCPEREILSAACPEFVPLIESGHFSPGDGALKAAVETYLRPMKEKRVEALLLGCTHYGLVADAIRAYLGGDVRLISASECAAAAAARYLTENSMEGSGACERFYTSGSVEEFTRLGSLFLGEELDGKVRFIPPEEE